MSYDRFTEEEFSLFRAMCSSLKKEDERIWLMLENAIRAKTEFDYDKLTRMILKPTNDPTAQLNSILMEIMKGLQMQNELFRLLKYRVNLLERPESVGPVVTPESLDAMLHRFVGILQELKEFFREDSELNANLCPGA